LSKDDLARALDAAWLVFQLEQGGLKMVVGLAGEAVAQEILTRVIGADAAKIFNLNGLVKDFPVLDLIAPTGVYSVKTRGLLSGKVGAALDSALIQEYTQDLVDLAVGNHPKAKAKLTKSASLLFNNRSVLQKRGSWPTGLNPRSIADVEQYIRDKTILLVPDNHVQLLKQNIGSILNARLRSNIVLPAGTNRVDWVNSFVDRIDSIGVKSSDLDVMLEAIRHLPADQVGRLQREVAERKRRRGF